ncbi:MAG TPA: hypothetical protein VFP87_14895 [Chitinophagaceae bacterium]|nr:hypothetical protein [Chitinophagaceae bacterium]
MPKTDIYKQTFSDDNVPDLDAIEENFYLIPDLTFALTRTGIGHNQQLF